MSEILPQISVIIPVYNTEKFLKRCLDSILNQTFSDFEILCVNDGSVDGRADILDAYALCDKRIRVFHQKNQGLSRARNYALEQAQGEFILFVDSDDSIHCQLMECTHKLALQFNADFVNYRFRRVLESALPVDKVHNLEKVRYKITDDVFSFYCNKTPWAVKDYVWTKLVRRDFIQDMPFVLDTYFEDIFYNFLLMKKKPKAVLIKHKFYYYTHNPVSITKTFSIRHIEDRHKVLHAVLEAYKDSALLNRVAIKLSRHLKEQYGDIIKLPMHERQAYLQVFQNALVEFNRLGLIKMGPAYGQRPRRLWGWLNRRGWVQTAEIPFAMYLTFKKLVLQKKCTDAIRFLKSKLRND